ncbi:hypothetical protein NWO25_06745 [Enterococcus lactis]|nr:hypothetical protein [Enterococcus lactis]
MKQIDRPLSNRAIAKLLGRAPQTIHSEVKDGTVRQIRRQVQNGKTYEYESFVYSADAGQAAYENARTNSRKQPKWVSSPKFMAYADHQMKTENKRLMSLLVVQRNSAYFQMRQSLVPQPFTPILISAGWKQKY